jgi:DNA-binding LacI/PurR family transcriptional regulator
VSKGAVSFALNGKPGVADSTRDRIRLAAGELGWRPSTRARALSVRRAFALGLVVARPPELIGADPFFPTFIAGVETVLADRGQALVLQVVPDGAAEQTGYQRLVEDGRVDGVFLTDLRHDDQRVELLRQLGLPAVTLNRPDGPSPFPAVCLDDKAGITQAVLLLARMGHRRLGFVGGPGHFLHGSGRRAAFEAAAKEAGLAPGAIRVADFTAAGGAQATAELLDLPSRPTGIVYANDLMAIAGMSVATQRGLRMPDDLSVTGFDDTEIAAHLVPSLTTVRTEIYDWGRCAATTLLSLVEADGKPPAELDHQMTPAALITRDSTGPPPAATTRPAHWPTRSPNKDRLSQEAPTR